MLLAVIVYRNSQDPFKRMARLQGVNNYYVNGGELKDRVELTPEYKRVEVEVDREVQKEVDDSGITGLGTCHLYWKIKKRILRERYGIDWRSPSEMNPWTIYD